MSDDINKKYIEKQMSLLEKIYFDDSDKYTNKERAEAAQKHRTLGELIGDDTVLVGPSKKTPMGKPGARRAKKRGTFEMGGLLEDERVGYADGTPEEEEENKYPLEHVGEKETTIKKAVNDIKLQQELIDRYGLEPDGFLMELKKYSDRINKLTGGQMKIAKAAPPFDEITGDDFAKLRDQKQEGGDIDGQMTMLMMSKKPEEEMLPDDEMEDEYLDFILDEALDSEEEDYLMQQLQGNERLSEIFDKVIDIAQEFAGSGPVEGPGSGVSDSIPARLSDGEFVFTAKAAKEIGADELMRMMKDAEMRADERQEMQEGGDVEEETVTMQPDEQPVVQEIRVVKETVDSPSRMIADEDEISQSIKSKMMLDPMQRHVRS